MLEGKSETSSSVKIIARGKGESNGRTSENLARRTQKDLRSR